MWRLYNIFHRNEGICTITVNELDGFMGVLSPVVVRHDLLDFL